MTMAIAVDGQTGVPARALNFPLSGEGVENLVRYSLAEGGSRTVSVSAAYDLDGRLVLLQGLDQERPGMLGLQVLQVGEWHGNARYEGFWSSSKQVDSLPEHYVMRFMEAQEVDGRLFLVFSMELEEVFGVYVAGIQPGSADVEGFVEVLRWDEEQESWVAPDLEIKSGGGDAVRMAASEGIYAVRLDDGALHVVDGRRVSYRYVAGQGFVLEYFPEGIHELKVKGLGTLRYTVPVPGHVVFIGQPGDLVKAAKAVSEAEGKRDIRMFSSTGGFEAYYLQAMGGAEYAKEAESGFLGRLMGEKLER